MRRRVIFLLLSILSIPIVQYVHAGSSQVPILSVGRINYSSSSIIYFPHSGEGDFELFPFCTGSEKGQDWDWVNGYQMDASGNLYKYGDSGNNHDVYIKQSTEHVQHGVYSAEFRLGEGAEPTHGSRNKHCKLYEVDQSEYPDTYLYPSDGQPEAYYSAWYWFPNDFVTAFSNWRLLMQWGDWSGGGHSYEGRSCFPTLVLAFERWRDGKIHLILGNNRFYREDDIHEKWDTGITAETIPKEQWVHIVAFVKTGSDFRTLDGQAILWINEKQVLDVRIGLWNYWVRQDYPKEFEGGKEIRVCWGIGNYGDKDNKGSVWIDNIQIANTYISG